ncbi:MAG: glycosyltransferase [Pirellulales bacterium]
MTEETGILSGPPGSPFTRNGIRRERVAIVLTNYNYQHYVARAIRSCQRQSHSEISIVVVDDGSVDDSVSAITDAFDGDQRCQLVRKDNGGQLSAFNTAVSAITEDVYIVVFLDADDVLEPDCVAALLKAYSDRPDVDFIFSTPRPFSEPEPPLIEPTNHTATDLGFTTAATWFCQEWIGAPTSGLSMRASLVRKLLPIPLESDWRIRADDCLVWGSSLAGARKMHLDGTLVHYRIHENNSFYGKNVLAASDRYRRCLAANRVWQHFDSVFALSRLSASGVYLEFRTQPRRTLQQALRYTRIARATRFRVLDRMRLIANIWARFAYDAVMSLRGTPQ